MMRARARATHLATRFAGSLRPRPVSDTDLAWVRGVLTEAEADVWEEQGRADQSESLAVARRAQQTLSSDDGPYIAAALLHDVGKTRARLGTIARALATVVAAVVGHPRARSWAYARRGWRRRVGIYIAHDDLGADELRQAGARVEAVEWAQVHHRRELWSGGTIPPEVALALAQADGEQA
jgi:hypothetical protein